MISNAYLIRQSFKWFRCETDIFALRVSWNTAYSPFKWIQVLQQYPCFRNEMEWFEGDVGAAISSAKSKQSIFCVFIIGIHPVILSIYLYHTLLHLSILDNYLSSYPFIYLSILHTGLPTDEKSQRWLCTECIQSVSLYLLFSATVNLFLLSNHRISH